MTLIDHILVDSHRVKLERFVQLNQNIFMHMLYLFLIIVLSSCKGDRNRKTVERRRENIGKHC